MMIMSQDRDTDEKNSFNVFQLNLKQPYICFDKSKNKNTYSFINYWISHTNIQQHVKFTRVKKNLTFAKPVLTTKLFENVSDYLFIFLVYDSTEGQI